LEKYNVPATFFITGANPAGLKILWGELVNYADQRWAHPIDLNNVRFEKGNGNIYSSLKNGEN